MELYANKTVLQGFIASELKLEPTKNGGQRCYFDIKIIMSARKKIEYIPITLWNAYAVQFVQNFHKGDNILIEGELMRNSGPDGRKYLVINCGVIRLIVPAQTTESAGTSSQTPNGAYTTNYAQKSSFAKLFVNFGCFELSLYAIIYL